MSSRRRLAFAIAAVGLASTIFFFEILAIALPQRPLATILLSGVSCSCLVGRAISLQPAFEEAVKKPLEKRLQAKLAAFSRLS
jgi:hypothetical protein